MGVSLRTITVKDPDLRQVQDNVAAAVEELSDARSVLGVLAISSNTKLVGNEDVVLVDASNATAAITLVLPSPKVLQRMLTVKITKTGTQNVVVKAVDIASVASPSIDGGASVTVSGSVRIVSDGRQFWTV